MSEYHVFAGPPFDLEETLEWIDKAKTTRLDNGQRMEEFIEIIKEEAQLLLAKLLYLLDELKIEIMSNSGVCNADKHLQSIVDITKDFKSKERRRNLRYPHGIKYSVRRLVSEISGFSGGSDVRKTRKLLDNLIFKWAYDAIDEYLGDLKSYGHILCNG